MDPIIMERTSAWAVLGYIQEHPGATISSIAGAGDARNKTREARVRDLTADGILRTEPGSYRNRPTIRYYLTPRGEILATILDMLVKI